MRYRGAAQTEFFRTLKALKDLQKEAGRKDDPDEVDTEAEATVEGGVKTRLARKRATLSSKGDSFGPDAAANEPERRPTGQESDTKATGNEPGAGAIPALPKLSEAARPADGRVGVGVGRGRLRPDLEEPDEPEQPAIAAHRPVWGKAARCRGPLFWPGENV